MIATHVRIALTSLRATRVRTALTTLGIVIGVTSICLVLALGEGVKQALNRQIASQGNDIITIRPGKVDRSAEGKVTSLNFWNTAAASTLTEYDLGTLQTVPGVKFAAPVMLLTGSIKEGARTAAGTSAIIATSPDFIKTQNLQIKYGQFLDLKLDRQTAVLGNGLAVRLFGTDDALGRQVMLRNKPFTVIGVLKPSEAPIGFGGIDYNDSAIVTMDAGKAFNQGVPQLQQINIRLGGNDNPDTVAAAMQALLLKNHGGEEDFAVLKAADTVQITNNAFGLVTLAMSAVASVSLLVGGIGIMNIMLVSVTERTREIGIRKAVGATNGQIMAQFLIEAAVMSLSGGVIGLGLAYAASLVAGSFMSFKPVITGDIAGLALLVSLAVGIVFGVFPAARAAGKDPIEALRALQ
ncbi:MAG: FtsX-like permease family protein [Candidatus Chaera renei]|uniref:FtsX-like permease family protein n=1 Tax=Candidatus Chaera renei TaxID=2506947 RepID=A0A4Q0AGE6_9BACT|nr:MAG: FtsX-like permease family protein [Candidatus Chaera renei]